MDSIAALRSVLMLDTPIRDALAVGNTDNNNYKRQEAQKLCFSPASMTQATTPASRHTHMNTPMSRIKTSAKKRSSSSPFFKTPTRLSRSPEVQQSATKVLEKKIRLLEMSHAELEERLKGEIDQRKALKTAYEKLSEVQTKQSSQLERITASRDKFRNESASLKETLETERSNHARTISFLQSTTSDAIQAERLREKESFKTESDRLKKRLERSEDRYAKSELLVKELTKEVEHLNEDLKKLRQAHELAMQQKKERHAKEVATLKNKIEQTESGLVEQVNKERKSAEANYEKLQRAQKLRTKLREEYLLEKDKMKDKMSELQESLKKAIDGRKESEQKVEKLSAELDSAKEKPVNDSSKLSSAGDQPESAKEPQEVQTENQALQQQLKDIREHRNQLQNELEETRMELDGLKQNLEEAERIEVQNEQLQQQLQVYKSDARTKDEMLRNMEVEVKKVENGNRNSGTFHKLQLELSKLKEELADSKEKLSKSRLSNLNRLVQVATHRERVRDLEGDLEELEEKLNEENSVIDITDDRKRDNDDEVIPRKRLKTKGDDEEEGEAEVEIVL